MTDNGASFTVITGDTTIRAGRASGPRGPLWRCDLWGGTLISQPETLIVDRSVLVPKHTYGRLCAEVGNRANNNFTTIVWDPADPTNGLGVTTRQLADAAANQLPIDAIIPALSPEGRQVTGLETWIWPGVARQTPTQYASAGGYEVGAYAYLTKMEFTPNDGGGWFACDDFTEWSRGASNPACSYTFYTESASGTWSMDAQTSWQVFWQDVGAPFVPYGFAEPADAFDIEVLDLEAVITR